MYVSSVFVIDQPLDILCRNLVNSSTQFCLSIQAALRLAVSALCSLRDPTANGVHVASSSRPDVIIDCPVDSVARATLSFGPGMLAAVLASWPGVTVGRSPLGFACPSLGFGTGVDEGVTSANFSILRGAAVFMATHWLLEMFADLASASVLCSGRT